MDHRDVYLNFVNGQWKQGSSGQWEVNRNPSRPSEILGKATKSNSVDVERAIDTASKAQPEWASRTRVARGMIIEKAAGSLRAKSELFAKSISRETGKNLTEARAEVLRASQLLTYIGNESRRPTGEVLPNDVPGTWVQTVRSPLGVVSAITPWNHPIYTPAAKIGAAILEGNTVIFKPSSLTPASAAMLTRAFEESGIPAGVLNLIYGQGSSVGQAILQDERIKAVSFTGSREVGLELNTLLARRFARAQVDLSGKTTLIVLADADLDLAVESALQGAFTLAGQRANASSRVVVERSIHALFTSKLVERAKTMRVGDGLADPAAMGPLIDEQHLSRAMEIIETAQKEGATLLCGGERLGVASPECGYYLAPTLFDNVSTEMALSHQEAFAPLLALLPVDTAAQAFTLAANLRNASSTSLFTRDARLAMTCINDPRLGDVHVNSSVADADISRTATTDSAFFSIVRRVHLNLG